MKTLKTAAMLGLLAITVPAFSQIIIDWDEIPQTDEFWTKNIKDTAVVDLGSVGGPQNWDFTSQPMGNDSCTNAVVAVGQTPWHDSFPGANLCYWSMEGPDTAYLYMQLATSFLSVHGLAGAEGGDTVAIMYDPIDTNDLPDHFGDFRNYYTAWTVNVDANTYMEYEKRGLEYINAYGSVTIPYGTFQCLRYVLWDTLISTLFYENVPIFSDTSSRIGHQFVAEDYSGVVCVYSYADETNPYFTNAQILERMTHFTGGIAETGETEKARILCCPNPFSDHVTFTCRVEKPSVISMAIYDAQGKMVRTIVEGMQARETKFLAWNGTNDMGIKVPAGVYFVQLKTADQQFSQKVILSR